jgi:hypothetical protein
MSMSDVAICHSLRMLSRQSSGIYGLAFEPFVSLKKEALLSHK